MSRITHSQGALHELLKRLYFDTNIGRWMLAPVKFVRDSLNILSYRLLPEGLSLQRQFKKSLGYRLSLQNPQTLNEKIQWLKLNDRSALHTICADKLAVREYVRDKIGAQYLIPLLWHTESPSDLCSDNMPDRSFVVKTNHDSGGVLLVKDKTSVDWSHIRKSFAKQLKTNYYHRTKEWQYKNIKPCILIEELLLDRNQNIPVDYKIHCFNGKVSFIQIDSDRQKDHTRNIYDSDWNLLDCRWLYENSAEASKPEMLKEMKSLAESIAKDFRYVRVDFYNISSKVYFGEITFHPESGFGKFEPSRWDKHFGDLLSL
jgi:hypothetical protein